MAERPKPTMEYGVLRMEAVPTVVLSPPTSLSLSLSLSFLILQR